MLPHGEGKSTKPRQKVLASAVSATKATDKGHHSENERVRTPHSKVPAVKNFTPPPHTQTPTAGAGTEERTEYSEVRETNHVFLKEQHYRKGMVLIIVDQILNHIGV